MGVSSFHNFDFKDQIASRLRRDNLSRETGSCPDLSGGVTWLTSSSPRAQLKIIFVNVCLYYTYGFHQT
jgi:hypothetical protein